MLEFCLDLLKFWYLVGLTVSLFFGWICLCYLAGLTLFFPSKLPGCYDVTSLADLVTFRFYSSKLAGYKASAWLGLLSRFYLI